MSDRSRKFCFTAWNMDVKPDEKYPGLRYLVYQKELSPTTKREHWQGYCEFDTAQRFAAVKKMCGDDTAHVELPKKSLETNQKYCTKPESRIDGPWEYGSPKTQGQRTDLEKLAKQVIDLSKPIVDTMIDNPEMTIRYPRGIQTLRSAAMLKAGRSQRDVKVFVLIGDPGSGKTRHIYDKYKTEQVYKLTASTQSVWFDHYDGEQVLLIDDYKGWIPYTYLLNLLDRYPVSLPVKGGHTYALWTEVYITSNYPVENWYTDRSFNREALLRRITQLTRLD